MRLSQGEEELGFHAKSEVSVGYDRGWGVSEVNEVCVTGRGENQVEYLYVPEADVCVVESEEFKCPDRIVCSRTVPRHIREVVQKRRVTIKGT